MRIALKVWELCACYFFLGDLANRTIMSSAVSSPLFSFSTAVRKAKPSFGSESIIRLRSAIGPRLSYCFSSSSVHSERRRALPEFLRTEIVCQALCPKGKVGKHRLSFPIHSRTSPLCLAIGEVVGPKKFRSYVS